MKFYLITALIMVTASSSYGATSTANPLDNAALIYKKAADEFDADEELNEKFSKAATGEIEIDEELAKKINEYDHIIEDIIAAGKMKNCDWGIDYSKGITAKYPDFVKLRNLGRLLVAKSRLFCKEGNYEQAINLCVTTEKYATDVCTAMPVLTVLVGDQISCMNDELITHIVGVMPHTHRMLLRIKSIVEDFEDRMDRMKIGFEGERRLYAAHFDYKSEVRFTYEDFVEEFDVEQRSKGLRLLLGNVKRALDKGDKEYFDVTLGYWNKTFARVIAFTELPYERAYTALGPELQQIILNFPKTTEAFTVDFIRVNFRFIYSHSIKSQSTVNALRTAIKIYLIRANTGGLPGRLPSGCPKDPFSGKDYVYEKTDDGFVLKCQGKDLKEDTVHEYEFKVKKL